MTSKNQRKARRQPTKQQGVVKELPAPPTEEKPEGLAINMEVMVEVLQNKLEQERRRGDILEAALVQEQRKNAQNIDQLSERFKDAQEGSPGDEESSVGAAG